MRGKSFESKLKEQLEILILSGRICMHAGVLRAEGLQIEDKELQVLGQGYR